MWKSCQTNPSRKVKSSPYICILGKPVDIPSARSLDVSDHNLEALEIECRDSIKSYIQEYKSPFEKGVGSVGLEKLVTIGL